jgi:hypothetical protein
MKDKRTWEIVNRLSNTKVLDIKWMFKIKRNPNGLVDRYKARLGIRGYMQQYGVDYEETFPTVCRFESIRLNLALTAGKGMAIKQFDVRTAFLNGTLDQ